MYSKTIRGRVDHDLAIADATAKAHEAWEEVGRRIRARLEHERALGLRVSEKAAVRGLDAQVPISAAYARSGFRKYARTN